MIARAFGVAVALSTIFSQPASASVNPLGEWRIEPSDARCVAVHKYGEPERPITLALKAPPEGHALQLAIIISSYRKSSDQVGAVVDIDGQSFRTYALGYPLDFPKASKTSVSLIHLPQEAAAALRSAKNLGVTAMGSVNELFPLGDFERAWTAMDLCLERLRQTWNIGESAKVRIATEAKSLVPMSSMLSPRDFPPQALAKLWTGRTSFLLLIDEKGAIRDCTLTESSGIAVVDSRSCAIISHKARFSPAVDAKGIPTKSAYSQSITWRVTD